MKQLFLLIVFVCHADTLVASQAQNPPYGIINPLTPNQKIQFNMNFLGEVIAQKANVLKVKILEEKYPPKKRPQGLIVALSPGIMRVLDISDYKNTSMVGEVILLEGTKVSGAEVGSFLDIEKIGIQKITIAGAATALSPIIKSLQGKIVLLKK